jgi:2-keto-3-deoxy-L-rhamnonate aldolase RhmA
MPNPFKDRLARGPAQFGSFASLASTQAAEALACHGFDFVLADLEHAQNDVSTLVGLLQAIGAGGAEAVVRAPWNDLVWIKRIMDAGGQSIMVPFVQTAEEARRAARAMRYPPAGDRGVAMTTRASRYGARPDYLAASNAEACLIVQAETAEAVGRIGEIASVDGVDAVFIGPSDLAASMGHVGRIQEPAVRAKIADGLAAAKRAGKPAGCLGTTPAECLALRDQGFDFVLLGTDLGIFVRQLRADVAALKEGGWTPRA